MATDQSITSPIDASVAVFRGGRVDRVRLTDYLRPADAEEAERLGNVWIKSLRHARIDGTRFRDRFVYRGDSLWWFAEIYLHKQRSVAQALAVVSAVEALIDRERPDRLSIVEAGPIAHAVAARTAAHRGVRCDEPRRPAAYRWRDRLTARLAPAVYVAGTFVQRWRARQATMPTTQADVVVFVHRAFWRAVTNEDTYVGPLLEALSRGIDPARIRLVGVGPQTNFRARTWRRRVEELGPLPPAAASPIPIEAFSPLAPSPECRAIWRERRAFGRALLASADLGAAAVVGGVDLWPLVGPDLLGVAHLQFPWSARALDEAASALDALKPQVVVTYAEAGGWGRALALEARRRRIPFVGIQHGFISRHWLNYLHEPDELVPSPENAADAGYPFPDATLLYDEFARAHLVSSGRFPADTLKVVGNQRMDALMASSRALTPADLERARVDAGAKPGQHLVLLAVKRTPDIDDTVSALMRAVSRMNDVHLAVRPHPAETAEPYLKLATGLENVRVVSGSLNPVALIAASRLVATINSTVAIEAMALDVPALAMRLPNYLSPFVEEGAMLGTTTMDEIGPAVSRLVHDDALRRELSAGRRRFVDRYRMRADGQALARTVAVIEELVATTAGLR